MIDSLDESNFLLYAAKFYDNPQCYDTSEFYEDLKRFKYVKRLLNRYVKRGDLKERLILNHVIALNNVFGPTATVRMMFLKLEGMEHLVKPFLVFLSILPDIVENINGTNHYTARIPVDPEIEKRLREL
jgi:hypothetical protein